MQNEYRYGRAQCAAKTLVRANGQSTGRPFARPKAHHRLHHLVRNYDVQLTQSLQAVAQSLNGTAVLGDGLVHRVLREAQREFLKTRALDDDAGTKTMSAKYSRPWVRRPGRPMRAANHRGSSDPPATPGRVLTCPLH